MASKKKTRQKAAAPAPESIPSAPPAAAPTPAPAPVRAAESALPLPPIRWPWVVPVLIAVFFLVTCLTSETTMKTLAMAMVIVTVLSCLVRLSYVRDRVSLPLLAVTAWVLMDGISTLYAVSGKFALRQFLRSLVGFCVLLLILAWSRRGRGSGRAAASILAGGTALASLFSIDTLSTHLLSEPLFAFLESLSDDFAYAHHSSIEVGARMLSIYENPNVFAGIAGLGVLLSLGLAVTAQRKNERPFHLCCLFLNALAFLLVFSMGASAMICLAFLVLLLLERKERKASLLILMIETLVLALLGAFPIFLTSFDLWDGIQPIPLLCAVGGCVALCLLDHFVGQKLSTALERGGGKLLAVLIALVLLLLAGFAALAVTQTGPASLNAGEALRRAEYPGPGTYTMEIQASGPVSLTVESQNQRETMMHTSTQLYSGDAQGAQFTVPEDSLVVYFNFQAGESLTLESAAFSDGAGSTDLKLHYKLLPGFIANRLQGLFANENAIQRVVFFADGMKLFRRSPVFGLGLGAFESAVQGVQSFYYETKYAHNHYVEALVSTGVVGLVLFVGVFVMCALAILKNLRRKEGSDPLSPALGAALVFMAGHAAVEVVFSFHVYLPMAFGVLGLICLCCGGDLPFLPNKEEVRSWCVIALCVLLAAYAVLLGMNMKARKIATTNALRDPYLSLERAAKLDFFETNDYLLSYVNMARGVDPEYEADVYTTANQYAQRLSKVDSNSIPPYLALYYFSTDQPEPAIATLRKFVNYVSSESETWQSTFELLQDWSIKFPQCRQAALEFYELLQTWNEENMGSVSLSEENLEYLESISAQS